MNIYFIKRSLGYHGQPMQMIWEDEHGTAKLRLDSPNQIDYSVYQQRQKYFSFQDRAKRLKLHQFLARKANELFDSDLKATDNVSNDNEDLRIKESQCYATTPPYEIYVNNKKEPTKCSRAILEAIEPGDIVYAMVLKCSNPLLMKPLCTAQPLVRYLNDVPAKAFLHSSNLSVLPTDNHNAGRRYAVGEYICSAVLELSIDADRLYLTMDSATSKNKNIKLGSIEYNSLPEYFFKSVAHENKKYVESLQQCKEFLNPNYDILFNINGLNFNETLTMMKCFKTPPRQEDYANALRQKQANQWAVRNVVQGITLFRDGHHVEAFQALNKALSIDPKNVEGLVARGALYANKRSFLKAIEDFETALKLNPLHGNAKNYIAETLVALGLSYEDDNKIPEAIKAYRECLKWVPKHEQALNKLMLLQTRKSCQPYLHLLTDGEVMSSSSSSTVDTYTTQTTSIATKIPEINQPISPLSQRMILHAATTENVINSDRNTFVENRTLTNADTDKNSKTMHADETLSQVRKLLHKASKYKKEKKKKHRKTKSRSASPKIREKNKKSKHTDYHANRNASESKQMLPQSQYKNYEFSFASQTRTRNSPPPPPPSISTYAKAQTAPVETSQKLSFQIRRPVKVDKFGLVRIATPLTQESSSSKSSKSRSRSRSRSRSSRHRSRTRSRSTDRRYSRRRDSYRSERRRSRSSSSRRSDYRRRRDRSRSREEYDSYYSESNRRKVRSPSRPNHRGDSQAEISTYNSRSCNMNDPSIEEIDELISSGQKRVYK